MNFEYDPDKSAANKAKHGIDFEEAKALWQDLEKLVIPARDGKEKRLIVIGTIGDKHWSAITTQREENVRIISVRRSRNEEVELYEDH